MTSVRAEKTDTINYWKYGFFACLLYIIYDSFYPSLPWGPLSSFELSGQANNNNRAVSRIARGFHYLQEESPIEHSPRHLSAAASNASTTNSNASDASVGNPHDALFFLFNALIVGTIILHVTMLPGFHSVQQTVCLFILGIMYSLIQEGLKLKTELGVFGISYDMWMNIDPHLLLFSMLPALLAGDAMTINTQIARSVQQQCIFLAGPGVVIGSFMTALFLHYFVPGWSFMLCLVAGAILSATDPVAVVGLLKELGASPTLTVQIQGESLLNDGTAIVLFTIAYDIVGGKTYDGNDVMIFLVIVALCAVGLGLIVGWLFLQWIKLASYSMNKYPGLIQTALTLCCAYTSFIVAEGMFGISGVLCTVTASLVLADSMWPFIVDKRSLIHCWHMFEYLGNTIVFFLAGALTGNTMVHIEAIDYLRCIVIYIVCMVIRAIILFSFRPLLSRLSMDQVAVTTADVAVMTWGGLRGAVGLAFAIEVSVNRADGNISDSDGRRMLFYVCGVATLTLCINATTCPMLVRWLGISRTSRAKQKILRKIFTQLKPMVAQMNPDKPVDGLIADILGDTKLSIQALADEQRSHNLAGRATGGPSLGNGLNSIGFRRSGTEAAEKEFEREFKKNQIAYRALRPGTVIIDNLHEARRLHEDTANATLLAILECPHLPYADQEEELENMVMMLPVNSENMKSVNMAFMSLVAHEYWHRLASGDFVGAIDDAEMLLATTSMSMKHAGSHICDLKYLLMALAVHHTDSDVNPEFLAEMIASEEDREKIRMSTIERGGRERVALLMGKQKSIFVRAKMELSMFVDSILFHKAMSAILILNAAFILIEQTQRKEDNFDHPAWLIIEISFTACFTIELVLKLYVLRMAYLNDNWNIFDFLIVLCSYFGLAIEFFSYQSGGATRADTDVSQEAKVLRLNKVFRVLRILRIVRLMRFVKGLAAKIATKDASLRRGVHMRTITVFRAFVQAHVEAQTKLTKLFGEKGNITTSEEARCILESQSEIYKALYVAAEEARDLEENAVLSLRLLRDIIKVVRKMVQFVVGAHESGVITTREANTLIHPFQKHIVDIDTQINKLMKGDLRSAEDFLGGQPLNFSEFLQDHAVDLQRERVSEQSAMCYPNRTHSLLSNAESLPNYMDIDSDLFLKALSEKITEADHAHAHSEAPHAVRSSSSKAAGVRLPGFLEVPTANGELRKVSGYSMVSESDGSPAEAASSCRMNISPQRSTASSMSAQRSAASGSGENGDIPEEESTWLRQTSQCSEADKVSSLDTPVPETIGRSINAYDASMLAQKEACRGFSDNCSIASVERNIPLPGSPDSIMS